LTGAKAKGLGTEVPQRGPGAEADDIHATPTDDVVAAPPHKPATAWASCVIADRGVRLQQVQLLRGGRRSFSGGGGGCSADAGAGYATAGES